MDYELAKQLKDAGFPQDIGSIWITRDDSYAGILPKNIKNGDIIQFEPKNDAVVKPTLSELIEACGDKFDCLIRRYDGVWISYGITGGDYNINTKGKTPEKAVARLWLELNKK